jgi:hypothetical protein
MLYKALAADLKSSHGWGNDFGPWVVDQWEEVEGPLVLGRNGFHCSDDILWGMYPVQVEFIAAVEVDGASIIQGKTQCWQKMRVTSIKGWPPAKSALVLDWAEGQCHASWESWFPSEAATYDMKHYQGQSADMLEVIEPVWRGMFQSGETIPAHSLHRTQGVHKLKPDYSQVQEPIIRLAYALALVLTGTLEFRGAADWVQLAENIHPGTWETVRGFAEDYWNSLEEL